MIQEKDMWRIRQLNDLSSHDLSFFNKVHPTYDDYMALYMNLKDMKRLSHYLLEEEDVRRHQRVEFRDNHEKPEFKSVPKQKISPKIERVQKHVSAVESARHEHSAQSNVQPSKMSLSDKIAQYKNKYMPKVKSGLHSFFESDKEYARKRGREV